MPDGQELKESTKVVILQKALYSKKYFRIGLNICIFLVFSVVISVLLFRFYQIIPYLIVGSLLAFLLLTLNIFREKGVKRKILWRLSKKTLAVPAPIVIINATIKPKYVLIAPISSFISSIFAINVV